MAKKTAKIIKGDVILKAREVTKVYGDTVKIEVLHGIDADIRRGTFTAIIGPSGSGKSTFLNLISFLDKPTRGDIVIDGTELSKLSSKKIADFRNVEMGFVFQFHYLIPEFNALENVLMPVSIRFGSASKEYHEKALRIMKRIGLEPYIRKFPNQLSGGQQQRVAIARALINSPKILFADEPTGNLDRETGEGVLDLMKEIVREDGTTLIMVTHDRDIALNADHIIELVDGKFCRKFDLTSSSVKKVRELLVKRACVME
jgi:lipoprotein-releasing system ATP-binding protein